MTNGSPLALALALVLSLAFPVAARAEDPPDTTSPSIALSAEPRRFSPNGDGTLDVTEVSITVSEASSIDVRLIAQSEPLRVWNLGLIDPGVSVLTWDGNSEDGTRFRDRAYRFEAVARDAAGNTGDAAVTVTIDTVRPRIRFTSIRPDPGDGIRVERFALRVLDRDPKSRGWFGVFRPGGRIGAAHEVRSSTHDVHFSWRPRMPVPPGNVEVGIALRDRAGNRSPMTRRRWRIHRPVPTRIVSRLERAGNLVALTFDDCVDPGAWRRILDVLSARNVSASFFCPGALLSARRELARRTVREGHVVGSHGWDHAFLPGLSTSAIHSRLLRDRDAWWRYGGATAAPYFRPPYGAIDARVVRLAGETSLPRLMLWDVDPQDWRRPGSAAIARHVVGHARRGSVILLHTLAQTAAALPTILDGLGERGLRPVNLDQLFLAHHATVSGTGVPGSRTARRTGLRAQRDPGAHRPRRRARRR